MVVSSIKADDNLRDVIINTISNMTQQYVKSELKLKPDDQNTFLTMLEDLKTMPKCCRCAKPYKELAQQVQDLQRTCMKVCPRGFIRIPGVENKCFHVLEKQENWEQAQKDCGDLDSRAHLAVIKDKVEQANLDKYLLDKFRSSAVCVHKLKVFEGSSTFWLSGRRIDPASCDSPITWNVNGKIENITYSNWGFSQPNCGIQSNPQSCLHANCYDEKCDWNDWYCSDTSCPVCQIEL